MTLFKNKTETKTRKNCSCTDDEIELKEAVYPKEPKADEPATKTEVSMEHHMEHPKPSYSHGQKAGGLDSFQKIILTINIIQVLLLFLVAYQMSSFNDLIKAPAADGQNTIPDNAPAGAGNNINLQQLTEDDDVKGSANAPVTIVEFSDYECPYCRRFATETLPQIILKYVDTGKAKLIFRDFPLSFHQNAQKAAEAAECAGDQGKYYEMHDKLFGNGVAGGVGAFKQYAIELGLDTSEFSQCLDSGKAAAEISRDFNDGQNLGVTGTPAFFINDKVVVGAQPFSVFEQIIEQELNK